MTPALIQTLEMIAEAMRGARDDWWVIGSAAVALHGGAPVTVADVDVLFSEGDAHRLLTDLKIEALPGDDDPLFRSTIFARWTTPPLAVEFMAGLRVATPTGWTAIRPKTRVKAGTIPIPSRDELVAILDLFGRPKDCARALLLKSG